MSTLTEIFGEPISVYTVRDGVRDEVMIEAPAADAQEAGYHLPVVFTKDAHTDLVTWDDDPCQDERGRLWDVLMMMRGAAKAAMADPGGRYAFTLYRVPYLTKSGNRSRAITTQRVTRHIVAQGYDLDGAPCLTILMPNES